MRMTCCEQGGYDIPHNCGGNPILVCGKSYLLTIFLHLFFVDQVVPLIVMITVLHLSQESRSQTHYIYLKAHNREGEGVRIEKCEEAQI